MKSPKYPQYSEDELIEWIGILYGTENKSIREIARGLGITYYAAQKAVHLSGVPVVCKEEVTDFLAKDRRCSVCHKYKKADSFHADKTDPKLGRAYICKVCRKNMRHKNGK